jgi:hypothetical protein
MNNYDQWMLILLITLGVVMIGQWLDIFNTCVELCDDVNRFLFGNSYHLNKIDQTRSESGNPITEIIVNY